MKKLKEKKGRILFKRIRYAKGRVELDYTEKFDDYFNELTMNMAQEPMDSFKEAFQALAPDIIDILELPDPKKELSKRIEVHTVNIKYETEKEIPGCVISLKIKRENRPGSFAVNTPYQLMVARDSNEDAVLDQETSEKIYHIMDEAEKYRSGERKQFELKFEEPEAKTEETELNFVSTNGKYVVKAPESLIGIIKSGTMIQLTQLINDEKLIKEDAKRKGIFYLNPGKKANTPNGFKKNAFSFIRNGDILTISEMMEAPILDYEAEYVNKIVLETIKEHFTLPVKEASVVSA